MDGTEYHRLKKRHEVAGKLKIYWLTTYYYRLRAFTLINNPAPIPTCLSGLLPVGISQSYA